MKEQKRLNKIKQQINSIIFSINNGGGRLLQIVNSVVLLIHPIPKKNITKVEPGKD